VDNREAIMSDETETSETGYRWQGLPITPAAIQELTLELFAGETVERKEIVAAVEKAHAELGGSPARAADFARSVKAALTNLKKAGKADNPAQGFWKILRTDGQPTGVLAVEPATATEDELAPTAELTLGEGKSSVYLYYYPAYRREAERNGSQVWPCKIGLSERDPVARVMSQASTAMPEPPRIGLLLRTSLPSQWEDVIHGVLALRGKTIEEAPGSEWFYTSPGEVAEIICYIAPDIKPAELGDAVRSPLW
jgi:hypothetical protein